MDGLRGWAKAQKTKRLKKVWRMGMANMRLKKHAAIVQALVNIPHGGLLS